MPAVGTPREGEELPAVGRPRPSARTAKFRQAAFTYLHVTVLYEAAAYALYRRGLLPDTRAGPPEMWLVLGAVVGLTIAALLYRWHNPWLARAIWLLHGLRLPTLIDGAFLPGHAPSSIAPSFYVTAIVIVVINLWMLARAAWDL